jgi:hypothetical protein
MSRVFYFDIPNHNREWTGHRANLKKVGRGTYGNLVPAGKNKIISHKNNEAVNFFSREPDTQTELGTLRNVSFRMVSYVFPFLLARFC